jgi:hypothetical protein
MLGQQSSVSRELDELVSDDNAHTLALIELVDFERDNMPLLKDNGHKTFASFLLTMRGPSPSWYERFKKGLELVGRERAFQVGSCAVHCASFATTPEHAERFINAAMAFRAAQGLALSGPDSRRLLSHIDSGFANAPVRQIFGDKRHV